MNNSPTIELNIALIPDESSAVAHVSLSRQMAQKYPTLIRLDKAMARLGFIPHLTLYQVPLQLADMPTALQQLVAVCGAYAVPTLQATDYAYNAAEASFELQYQATPELLSMQDDVIGSLNPLRGGLLIERDPAGNELNEVAAQPTPAGQNVQATGYAEVGDPALGGLFRPHVTLNWFEIGTQVSTEGLPPARALAAAYPALGIFAMGPYGTCTQRIAAIPLGTAGVSA